MKPGSKIALCAMAGLTLALGTAAAQTGGPAPADAAATLFASPTYQTALAMWRAPREKGACLSCHGPDFVDLAVIGTSDADIVRRATLDGASALEASQLLAAIREQRDVFAIPASDPRSFRPLQPGGAVLPGATSIERDAAFAAYLVEALPELAGPARIDSLAAAKRARDALLAVDYDTFRIGIELPLWSADRFHGAAEGRIDDWIADLAQLPRADADEQWIALQDTYLSDPSPFNFWRLYLAVGKLTETFPTVPTVDPKDRVETAILATQKYRVTLIGQHLLRSQALGHDDFMRGPVPFSYLANEEPYRTAFNKVDLSTPGGPRLPNFLPNPLWEFADTSRPALNPSELTVGQKGNRGTPDLFVDRLQVIGYPQFVLDSIDPLAKAGDALHDLKIAWFMLGARFDPAMQRMTGSNSTKVGEYFQLELQRADYFNHRVFIEAMRSVYRAYRPDSVWQTQTAYNLTFGHLPAYNRDRPTRWNSPDNTRVPVAVKEQQLALYKRITANFYRMSLFLHEEALDKGQIAPYGVTSRDGHYDVVKKFLDYAGQPGLAEDLALIRRVAAKSQTPLTF